MITLGDLHEASLLHNICIRLSREEIYTFTGNILVAINPYKALPIYGGEMFRKYQGKSLGELPPHIYAVANESFAALSKTSKNQCVVIRFVAIIIDLIPLRSGFGVNEFMVGSGESGSGKTESTKHILSCLSVISSKRSLIQDQIMDASPILEAFGNAKTVRNDNSSRFGKFLEVQFASDGSIKGALTLQYLLEKVIPASV